MVKKARKAAGQMMAFMVCLVMATAGLIAALPIRVEASQVMSTNEPRWVSDPTLQNRTPLRGPNRSNGALVAEIFQFLLDHAHDAPGYHGGIVDIPGERRGVANINMRLSDILSEHIRRGWQNDTFWTPFNNYYFNIILDNTHFALYSGGGPSFVQTSFYHAREFDSHIGANIHLPDRRFGASPVPAGNSWRRQWPEINTLSDFDEWDWYLQFPLRAIYTILHEFGHALGLNESLNELFVESLFRGYFPRNYARFYVLPCGTRINYDLPGYRRDRVGRMFNGDISYSTVFVETLQNLMTSQGRAEEFWRTAFHSNQAFIELWDAELGHVVTFDDLWTAKKVDFFVVHRNTFRQFNGELSAFLDAGSTFISREQRDQMLRALDDRIGERLTGVFQFRREVLYWDVMMTNPRSSAAERNAATQQFNNLIRIHNNIAQEFGIHPKTAVLDDAIRKQNRIIDNTRSQAAWPAYAATHQTATSGQATIHVPSWNWPIGTEFVTLSINYQNEGQAVRNLGYMQVHVSEFPFAITLEGTGSTTITVYSIENGVSILRHVSTVNF